MANLVALSSNWWNLYVRFYDEERHREAVTSRPALMHGVARQVQSGGQRKVKVSLQHEYGEAITRAVREVSSQFPPMMGSAEQWTIEQRWALLLTRLLRRWLGGKWLSGGGSQREIATQRMKIAPLRQASIRSHGMACQSDDSTVPIPVFRFKITPAVQQSLSGINLRLIHSIKNCTPSNPDRW